MSAQAEQITAQIKEQYPALSVSFRHARETNEIYIRVEAVITSDLRIAEESAAQSEEVIYFAVGTLIEGIQREAISGLNLEPKMEQLARTQAEKLFRERVWKLRKAWTDPGDHPAYHHMQMARLAQEWAPLYAALRELLA